MLEKSDKSIAETLAVLTRYDLDVGLLVPTDTGMQKSIMDATAGLREYFQDTGFHDYDTQAQGPDAKVIREAFFVRPDGLQPTTASLYCPVTKSGDPRVWFGRLKGYAEARIDVALFAFSIKRNCRIRIIEQPTPSPDPWISS